MHGSGNMDFGLRSPGVRRSPLNDGWTVRPKTNRFTERMGTGPEPAPVTLPHDALIGVERLPSGDAASAYFPAGTWEYRRTLELPIDDGGTSVSLEFEGVYRDARVLRERQPGRPPARRLFGLRRGRSTTCSVSGSPTR